VDAFSLKGVPINHAGLYEALRAPSEPEAA
jgi:hypothetical protein